MGRPLTSKWIGIKSPAITPICNVYGNVTECYILKQVGSNKFIVCPKDDNNNTIVMTLTNGITLNHGDGYIGWQTNLINGYVSRISDSTLKSFDNNSIEWTLYNQNQSDNIAYVFTNSGS